MARGASEPDGTSVTVSKLTERELTAWLVREQLATVDSQGRRIPTAKGSELAAAVTWQLEGSGRLRGRRTRT